MFAALAMLTIELHNVGVLPTVAPVTVMDATVVVAAGLTVEAAADGSNRKAPPAPTARAEFTGRALGLATISVPDETDVPPL